jgi:hypothetical protein
MVNKLRRYRSPCLLMLPSLSLPPLVLLRYEPDPGRRNPFPIETPWDHQRSRPARSELVDGGRRRRLRRALHHVKGVILSLAVGHQVATPKCKKDRKGNRCWAIAGALAKAVTIRTAARMKAIRRRGFMNSPQQCVPRNRPRIDPLASAWWPDMLRRARVYPRIRLQSKA